MAELFTYLKQAQAAGRTIHFLPPYREEHRRNLWQLLGIAPEFQNRYASEKLIEVIVEQRSIKGAEEIQQLQEAHEITRQMHLAAMQLTRPGLYEREISGTMEGIALAAGGMVSFPPIVSVNGQILHNHFHGNKMNSGDLLVVDAGAENDFGYAGDITRTLPVGGKFSSRQRDIYDIVLAAQTAAIGAIKPGVFYKEVHLLAARTISDGLKNIGLMKGDVDEAVELGVHALFFPHGLGHMLGLDVHDMENLGERYVGYSPEMERSGQFGLAYLRLARELREGFVLTVEPGIYFIPELIGKWQSENKFSGFINYEQVLKYEDFGGIRIEDDVIVRAAGAEILGQPIPKTAAEVEAVCRK
jgi:Xaa-Pro aminopeptidase